MSGATPEEIAQDLVARARAAGADAADALAIRSEEVAVGVRARQLEEAERSESLDFGLRVLVGGRQANVSASDPDPKTLNEIVERVIAMAETAPEDEYAGLLEPDELAASIDDLDLLDPAPQPSPETLQELALAVEEAALSVDGVSQVEQSSATWSRTDLALAASNGFQGAYGQTRSSLGGSAVAGEGLGMETGYDYVSRRYAADLPEAVDVGRKAGERAVERIGSRKPPTGAFPVIFDQRVAPSLVGHLVGAINGAAVARGSSWLIDKLGEAVLPKGYGIEETPHLRRGPASRPFDGEGAATRAKTIVDDGVLQTWILDASSARRLGLSTTGNAGRGVGRPPSPSTTNLRLTGGGCAREDLIAGIGRGLLVNSLIGASINATTGDYSRGASGFWVENGEIVHPVNELTIAGNLLEMLSDIEAADDPDLSRAVAAPTLRVGGLTVAGG